MSIRPDRRRRLYSLPLEDRTTPALWGNAWPDAQNITLSFAPNGTNSQGLQSNLFSDLAPSMTQSLWQTEILRAVQAWSSVANVSIGLTADGGQPFGEAGPVQGNPNYGDLRIGSVSLTDSELAVSTPFDLLGTSAGDIFLNNDFDFSVLGAAPGSYDLYTVALQEVGHALGLSNSPLPSSVMFSTYGAPRSGLDASDIANIQALYGARPNDRFDAANSNETLFTAKTLKYLASVSLYGSSDPTSGSDPYIAAGDITTAIDKDTYKVTVPAGTASFPVHLRTSGNSLLQAKVTVYNGWGMLVTSASASDSRNGDLALTVNAPPANATSTSASTYYVRVEAGTSAAFATGRYKLAVGTQAHEGLYPALSTALSNLDSHSNDSRNSATDLGRHEDLPDFRTWENTVRGSIHSSTDKDFYKIRTDTGTDGHSLVLTGWASEAAKLNPVFRVYSWNGTLQAAEVLANDDSTYTLQVRNIEGNKDYYLEVAATDAATPATNTGNYFFAVDVREKAIGFNAFDSGGLTDTAKEAVATLDVSLSRLYHFNLSATSLPTSAVLGVRMTIYSSDLQVVASIMVKAGETAYLDITLNAGSYFVKFSGGRLGGGSIGSLGYSLTGLIRNDPIGPGEEDPTEDPSGLPPEDPGIDIEHIDWWGWTDGYSDPWAGG